MSVEAGKCLYVNSQYVKETQKFKIKIYNLCYSLRYTYDMRAYTVKKHFNATTDLTPTHGAIMQLGRRVEDVGHKLYMDN
jgi:hypothetical protein